MYSEVMKLLEGLIFDVAKRKLGMGPRSSVTLSLASTLKPPGFLVKEGQQKRKLFYFSSHFTQVDQVDMISPSPRSVKH